jgi:nickel-dependent lactate racemase
MSIIKLPYGSDVLELDNSSGALSLLQHAGPTKQLDATTCKQKLAQPLASAQLSEIASTAKSALIVISDSTRITGSETLVPVVVEILNEANILSRNISIMVARGNHRPAREDEIEELIGTAAGQPIQVLQHESSDHNHLRNLGKTPAGTDILLNEALFTHDLVVTIGAVTAHYFAGFGGGRKSIFPGLGGREAIIHNHLLSIDFQKGRLADGVAPCNLHNNPVHEDMLSCVCHRAPDFSINTIINDDHQIADIFCGHWLSSHTAACEAFVNAYGVEIEEKRPLVIASCGGSPKDIDLIQSHKTIQYATRALEDGGTLLLLAECQDGTGSPTFESFFPIADMKSHLQRLRRENPPNGQTAVALHEKTEKFNIKMISSLDDDLVRSMGIEPVSKESLSQMEKSRGYLIPYGAVTIPTLR